MEEIKQLIDDYKRRLKTIMREIKNGGNDHQLTRLGTKASCYRSFIVELERDLKDNEYENSAVSDSLLERAMLTLDDYLNAGDKEARRKAAENAKILYKEYYGVDYVNRTDRD